MKTIPPGAFTLAVFLGFAGAVPVQAMGDGNTTQTCPKGKVLDKKTNKCVKASSGVLPDGDLYQQGRALALAGRYEDALEILALVKNQNDPRVLNYTGYANRKAGRLDVALGYYRRAIAIDPDFVLAREYLGEGYVAAGRIDLAKLELGEIAARCGTTCEEYQELSAHIAAAN